MTQSRYTSPSMGVMSFSITTPWGTDSSISQCSWWLMTPFKKLQQLIFQKFAQINIWHTDISGGQSALVQTLCCVQLFFRKSQRNPSPFQASWVMTNPFSFGLLFLHFAVNVGEWATQPTRRHLARADYMALVWRFGLWAVWLRK